MSVVHAPRALGLLLLFSLVLGPARARAEEPAPRSAEVTDEQGQPLPEARLSWAETLEGGRALLDPAAPPAVLADAAGRLRDIPPAPDGRLGVLFAPGRVPALYVPTQAAPYRLPAAARVRGTVRWSGGRAAAQVRLVLEPLASAGAVALRARTDAAGQYGADTLAPGPWRLLLERADGRRQLLRSVGGGADAGESVAPRPGGIKGRLVDARASGSVGAPELALRLVPLPRRPGIQGTVLEARSDAEGRFLLLDVPPGAYDLELLDGDWMFDDPVARVEAPGEGTVREASWFVARRVSLAGRVEDAQHRVVGGASVCLLADPRQAATPAQPEEPAPTTTSDLEGRFLLGRLRPAPGLRLLVAAKGFAPFLSEPFELAGAGETRLKPVMLGAGFDLDLEVRGEGEKPVAGVEVTALAAEHPGALSDPALAPFVSRGRTDPDGRLTLRALADSAYGLTLTARGYLPASQSVDAPRGASSARRRVLLVRAPALTGRVVLADGRPAGGRTVRAWPRDPGERVPVSVVTAADGAFALEDLRPVPHDLEVLGAGDLRLVRVEGVNPGEAPLEVLLPSPGSLTGRLSGLRAGAAASVLLEAEVTTPEEGRLRRRVVSTLSLPREGPASVYRFDELSPGAYVVRLTQGALSSDGVPVRVEAARAAEADLELPEAGSVAGSVLDALGRPAFGVRVALTRLFGDGDAHEPPGGPQLTVTSDRGAYAFSEVGPGLWRVACDEPGQGADVEVLRVADGETVLVRDLSLLGSATLSGHVRHGDGRPVDGARLTLRLLEADGALWQARTAGDGGYRVDGLWPGTYEVRVDEGPGAEAARAARVVVEPGGRFTLDFVPPSDGVIEGLVTRRGQRAAGVRLRAELEPEEGAALWRALDVVTDGSGTFAFRHLEAGTYRLRLEDGTAVTGGTVVLQDGDRSEVDLELWDARLPGVVLGPDGRSVPGAEVSAAPERPVTGLLSAQVRTDADGRFVLTGLPPGPYVLTVRCHGRPTGRLDGAQADLPGADRPVTVVLGLGARLDVEVRGRDGRPVSGARLSVSVVGEQVEAEVLATTGPSGRVLLDGVPAGHVRVQAFARDVGRASASVDLEEGASGGMLLRLEAPGSLLVGLDGVAAELVSRASVDVLLGDEVVVRRRPLPQRFGWLFAPLLRAGVLRINDLAPGDYTVRLEAGPRWGKAQTTVRVKSGEAAPVRLRPERPAR